MRVLRPGSRNKWKRNVSTRSKPLWRTCARAQASYGGIFDYDAKSTRLIEVNRELEDPNVWNDSKHAQSLGKEKKVLEGVVHVLGGIENDVRDTQDLFDMAREEGDEDTRYGRALKLRTETSKASVKKFEAYSNYANADGHVRNMFVFAGAGRTARWSGSGVQLQNMMRPTKQFEKAEAQERLARQIQRMSPGMFEFIHPDPMDALGSGVRGLIQAPPGYRFVSADFNAIENRVVGWIAGEERILNVFLDDRDPYVDFATFMFGNAVRFWGSANPGFFKGTAIEREAGALLA